MKKIVRKIGLISIIVLNTKFLAAQDSQKQIWPELDFYYKLNDKFRLYAPVSGTKSNSSYTDGTAGLYLDFFALPWLRGRNNTDMNDSTRGYFLWFRGGYSYSAAPPEDKQNDVNMLVTEVLSNVHLPAEILLEVRNRIDWRWVNAVYQPIYRPRLKFIRNLKTEFLTFNAYLWSEYFLYWTDNPENRLRVAAGTVIKVLSWLNFETYYMYQFSNSPKVSPVNAIGLQLDMYFNTKKSR